MSRTEDFDDLLRDLEAGLRVPDTRIDKIFPVDARSQGHVHWTPVNIALEAVAWLTADSADGPGARRILDIGSNVGKFCVVGALASAAHFTGVERRRKLVDLARSVTRNLRIQRVKYLWRDMAEVDWNEFQGIYLYNPFHENIDPEIQIDTEVKLNPDLFASYVKVVQEKLEACPAGTRVVTYYGFGGDLPSSFERVYPPQPIHERLEFWIKRS
ncbi:MAG: hypothetical protein JST16_06545 [Bdellovibrionales bacterium]|nr:hypothetical protein [Bdellovibrionales bacterium]